MKRNINQQSQHPVEQLGRVVSFWMGDLKEVVVGQIIQRVGVFLFVCLFRMSFNLWNSLAKVLIQAKNKVLNVLMTILYLSLSDVQSTY